jgi:ribosomal protein S8E
MADSKTTTTKTIAGGTLISTPVEKAADHSYTRTNTEFSNQYGFAVIKSDGSVVAWGQNSYVSSDLDGTVDAVQIYFHIQG